jgi:hypothetical protein
MCPFLKAKLTSRWQVPTSLFDPDVTEVRQYFMPQLREGFSALSGTRLNRYDAISRTWGC